MIPQGWEKYGAEALIHRAKRKPEITLHRKGQKCRFYDASGEQIGPEQKNVAPALAWAMSEGYRLF